MIFSEEVLLNIWGLAQLATIIIFILFAASIVLTLIENHVTQSARRKSIKRTEELMRSIAATEETVAHKHLMTHAHQAGEAIKKGDLIIGREDGLMYKADKSAFESKPAVFLGVAQAKEDTTVTVPKGKTISELRREVEMKREAKRKVAREKMRAYRAKKRASKTK